MCLVKAFVMGLLNARIQKTGQWYLISWSRKGSPMPLRSTEFVLEVNKRSMIDEEDSVKCVGSCIKLCRLNCWQMPLILFPEACFCVSKLKSPTIRISLMFVS